MNKINIDITLEELLRVGQSLDLFQALPMKANHAFRVAPTMKALRNTVQEHYDAQNKVLKDLGLKLIPMGPNQHHVMPIDDKMEPEEAKELQTKFMEQRDELVKERVQLSVRPIPLSAFYKANGKADIEATDNWHEFAADDMEALTFLIFDDVNEPVKPAKPKLETVK